MHYNFFSIKEYGFKNPHIFISTISSIHKYTQHFTKKMNEQYNLNKVRDRKQK